MPPAHSRAAPGLPCPALAGPSAAASRRTCGGRIGTHGQQRRLGPLVSLRLGLEGEAGGHLVAHAVPQRPQPACGEAGVPGRQGRRASSFRASQQLCCSHCLPRAGDLGRRPTTHTAAQAGLAGSAAQRSPRAPVALEGLVRPLDLLDQLRAAHKRRARGKRVSQGRQPAAGYGSRAAPACASLRKPRLQAQAQAQEQMRPSLHPCTHPRTCA